MSLVRSSRVSALMAKQAMNFPSAEELKNVAKGVGVFGVGAGVGSGLGYAANRLILPKVLKSLTPIQRTILSGGIGMAGGLASAAATRKLMEMAERGKRR